MNILETKAYRAAFISYLRRGTPIALSLKAEAQPRTTPQYIWRTRSDSKVRASHAANNGKVFSWASPPATGNPGEDYNCRCWAEPYIQGYSEFAHQTAIGGLDAGAKWGWRDFVRHFYLGGGRVVTLAEIGHLSSVMDYYFFRIVREGKNTYERVNAQIIEAARARPTGAFSYSFGTSYTEFYSYMRLFGGSTVNGVFNGTVRHENGMMRIQGDISYRFSDTFTDILDIRELLRGSSEPLEADLTELGFTDIGGTFYDIVGTWEASFRAEAKLDAKNSIYQ